MGEVSAETRLPAASSTAGGVTNSIPIWQAAGYTPTKAINAWKGFAAAVNAAFPDKQLAMESITLGAFPAINEQGKLVSFLRRRDAADHRRGRGHVWESLCRPVGRLEQLGIDRVGS
jgi:hypothetical protein